MVEPKWEVIKRFIRLSHQSFIMNMDVAATRLKAADGAEREECKCKNISVESAAFILSR